ncbi:MAG: hypothetical protein ACRDJC_16685 [Thermomicrobiales bacterium]
MYDWYRIETEVEHRRREWQREVEADMRATQAIAENGRTHLPHLPHFSLASLRSLAAPRLPFTSPLAPRRRTVAC